MTADIDSKEFISDWNSGLPINRMADKYGISKGRIATYAKQLGLPKRGAGRRSDLELKIALTGGSWVRRGHILVYERPNKNGSGAKTPPRRDNR